MKQDVPFSSRIKFPSISGLEIGLLILSIIIGIVLITYSGNIILVSFYVFVIFVPIGINIRNIKAAIGPHMLPVAFILIGINFLISIFAYYTAAIGILLYFIVLLHRYRSYQKLTGG